MGEKITDAQVADLLAILRTDAPLDTKVAHLNVIKSGIKQHNVPESCIPSLFEVGRTTSTNQHAVIASAGFSTLNHLLTRLSRQEPKYIAREAPRTLPLIGEKLGDQKEKYRTLAAQAMTTVWTVAPMDVERIMRNTIMVSKNPRAKEASLNWLVQMHKENGLQFRAFVPVLMELLEDADPTVRETAKNAVIELFKNAPNSAKSDLKRQMKSYNVRPAIVNAITNHLVPTAVPEPDADALSALSFADSVSSHMSARPETPALDQPQKTENVEPLYVNTQRELDETFREMHAYFDGKESEQNWLQREKSCTKLRRLNVGNAPTEFREAFIAGIKGLLDGILKAANSLRTSLAKEGCFLLQDLAKSLGPGIDGMVDITLQNLIKLCGGTKKIMSQLASDTVDAIVSRVTYTPRLLQHIWFACQDKNVQPRTYATEWLKTLIKKEAHHKSHLEHTGGVDVMEKCMKKGLSDPNPGVREKMRSAYWTFAKVWPQKAEALMATLDSTQQRLLESSNPDSPKKTAPSRPGAGFSKSTTSVPKPSLRETMLAQKKAAMAARNLPARPESAMSSFSPVRQNPSASTSSTAKPAAKPSTLRSRTDTTSRAGLSAAPIRPVKAQRPEISRPATAGPYSVRRPGHGASENLSPSQNRPRTPSVSASTQRKVAPRPNTAMSVRSHTSHASHPSPSSTGSPSKALTSKIPRSPNSSPIRPKSSGRLQGSSPMKPEEDLTMVMPNMKSMNAIASGSPPSKTASSKLAPALEIQEKEVTTPKSLQVYEDPVSNSDDLTISKPQFTEPVLEEVPVNEDASNLIRAVDDSTKPPDASPEKTRQNSKLLDSGITRVKTKSLDVHGFRKLQGVIRDSKVPWTEDKFSSLLTGLFEYLESPIPSLSPEKAQDVKAQILVTIKFMLKGNPEAFKAHVDSAISTLLVARAHYDSRNHLVGGMELLAEDLVMLADPLPTEEKLVRVLYDEEMTTEGCRALSMGLHILKELLERHPSFVPERLDEMGKLALRCLDSPDSGVRMDAVKLCVSMHARVGEQLFWDALQGVKEDPKSLITYYVVKRQREGK